ncbi:hypothetical protein HYS91_02440 [Candidatus Daviesbacteria bacterium]|nr:hypothetical protein [Candidatus Daviesbacteria bacterium]
MKLFLVILIVAAILQTTLIPLNLCLTLLIARTLIVSEKMNLFLAFLGGILVGFLSSQNIGFYAIFFLLISKLLSLVKITPIHSNIYAILPLSFLGFLLMAFGELVFLKISLSYGKIIVETCISIPTYFLLRFWEGRFIVRPQIKLRVKS